MTTSRKVLFGFVFYYVLAYDWDVRAHAAPSGWIYPPGCCNGTDCRPEQIVTTPKGFLVPALNVTIPYGDGRIRPSGDSETHVCRDDWSVFCLYIPSGT